MSKFDTYKEVFVSTFGVSVDRVEGLEFKSVPAWDSVGQMNLIGALEEAFNIQLDPDDMIDLVSFEKGKEILSSKYSVEF